MHATLATLDCEIFPETPAGKPSALVICCHGFGAPGSDLVPLRDELVRLKPTLATARFIFPAAPIDLAQFGGHGSRAWWLIDFEKLQAAQRGDPDAVRAFRQVEPVGMQHARALLLKLIDEACAQSGLGLGRVVLMGFSQGAMLSTDVALRLPEAPLGLVALSSTLMIEPVWAAKAKARPGLKVFQSHGRQDQVLDFRAAEWLQALFKDAGMHSEFVPFDGGHEIPLPVLRKAADFLARLLA